jgi:hypothetical protein
MTINEEEDRKVLFHIEEQLYRYINGEVTENDMEIFAHQIIYKYDDSGKRDILGFPVEEMLYFYDFSLMELPLKEQKELKEDFIAHACLDYLWVKNILKRK